MSESRFHGNRLNATNTEHQKPILAYAQQGKETLGCGLEYNRRNGYDDTSFFFNITLVAFTSRRYFQTTPRKLTSAKVSESSYDVKSSQLKEAGSA